MPRGEVAGGESPVLFLLCAEQRARHHCSSGVLHLRCIHCAEGNSWIIVWWVEC